MCIRDRLKGGFSLGYSTRKTLTIFVFKIDNTLYSKSKITAYIPARHEQYLREFHPHLKFGIEYKLNAYFSLEANLFYGVLPLNTEKVDTVFLKNIYARGGQVSFIANIKKQ